MNPRTQAAADRVVLIALGIAMAAMLLLSLSGCMTHVIVEPCQQLLDYPVIEDGVTYHDGCNTMRCTGNYCMSTSLGCGMRTGPWVKVEEKKP